jgi:diphosphomevalonate decarboxylase
LSYIKAIAHPNFALIKYWGKSDIINNRPDMSSISVTIDSLRSSAKVSFDPSLKEDHWSLNSVDQRSLGQILPTIEYLRSFKTIKDHCLIESENNFPTSAGLASSASGLASIVLAVSKLFKLKLSNEELIHAAMLGSASAPRSLFSGFVYLNKSENYSCQTILEPNEWPLKVIICLTSAKQKTISSREGMIISKSTSPYYQSWVNEHEADVLAALKAIRSKNFSLLGEVVESNCEKMHNIMETSNPPLIYRNRVTQLCVDKIKEMKKRGSNIFYTIDAGPQVKIICQPKDVEIVTNNMKLIPNIEDVIQANLGQGGRVIDES